MLRETGEAKVISQENIQIQLAGIGLQSSKKLFTETGIGILIRGNYFMLDDQLVILPSIIDTETGEVHTSTPIKGSPTNKEDLLKDLTQKILGYWKVRNQKRYLQKPPDYKAYLEYLKGLEVFYDPAAEKHFKKAYQLDTTFISPLLKLLPFYHNRRRYDAQDSLYAFLESKQPNFTRWELLIYQFMQARDDGNMLEAANLSIEAARMDPSHFLSYNRAAQIFYRNNYPQRAIEVLQSIDTILMSKEEIRNAKEAICHVTILRRDYEKAIEMSEAVLATRKLVSYEPENYVDALIYSRQFAEMHSYIQNLEGPPTAPWLYRICNALKVVGEDSLLQFYAEDLKIIAKKNRNSPWYSAMLGQASMFMENWDEAISNFEQYISKTGKNNFISDDIYGDLSFCYAMQDQMFKANKLLNELDRPSARKYFKSRILVIENKYEEAMDGLSEGKGLSYSFDWNTYIFDYKLKPLFDNLRFQELVKAKD